MTATDELRRMLDERGVKWSPSAWDRSTETYWKTADGNGCLAIQGETKLRLSFADYFTPEQAIAVTLGQGTCHNAMPLLPSGMPYPDSWMCSECGGRMDGIILETGNFCPNCGRKVVSE